ncbi:MAG: hypothetical protein K9N23_12840 [Akkermansiaceae bacterium]|nr:hypothetical protein [Akkermansiaceae bacterium]
MFDPIYASKSPLSSRIALPSALLLAGFFGLAIVLVQPPVVSKKTGLSPSEGAASSAFDRPEGSESNPPAGVTAAVEEDLVQFCSRHVTAKRSFVVFRRGTCVIINEPCQNPMTEARAILAKCDDANARFITEPTSEGDLIVTFKEPVFHRFAPAEITAMEPVLVKTASILLSPAESVAAGGNWLPPSTARLGLLARRRMLEDAAQAEPIRIVRARERVTVSR